MGKKKNQESVFNNMNSLSEHLQKIKHVAKYGSIMEFSDIIKKFGHGNVLKVITILLENEQIEITKKRLEERKRLMEETDLSKAIIEGLRMHALDKKAEEKRNVGYSLDSFAFAYPLNTSKRNL